MVYYEQLDRFSKEGGIRNAEKDMSDLRSCDEIFPLLSFLQTVGIKSKQY